MKFPFSLFEKKSGDNTATQVAKPSVITPAPSTASVDLLSPPPVERPSFRVPGESTSPPSPQVEVTEVSVVSSNLAAEVLSVSEAAPVSLLGQMETPLMTAEDVIAAYKIFLRRRPENMDGVTPRVGLTGDRILFDYLMSDEFTSRPEVAQLVFNCAKKIVDAKKVADAAAGTGAGATGAESAPAAASVAEPTPGLDANKAAETQD